jgi:hypothetical protein
LEAVEGFQEIAPAKQGQAQDRAPEYQACLNAIGWIDGWMCPRSLVCENLDLRQSIPDLRSEMWGTQHFGSVKGGAPGKGRLVSIVDRAIAN